MRLSYAFILLFPLVAQSFARPVSYPESWTSMLMNDGDKHSLHVHYSPRAYYSLGLKSEYWREEDFYLNALQLNRLLKRWNRKDSQANLYLKSALGVAHRDENAVAGFLGIAADWETRRFFTSYSNRYTEAGSVGGGFMQSAHIGVAPYIGDYGDLHTWLMLEGRHSPESKNTLVVTPLVRLFKDVHLFEFGLSSEKDVLLNWIIRF